MGAKLMQDIIKSHLNNGLHSVSLKVSDPKMGTKRGYTITFINSHRARLPMALFVWVVVMAFVIIMSYKCQDDGNNLKRKESLSTMCDQRARMLKDQFIVSVNHVHALAILVSTFYYSKDPRAIDQETFAEHTARTSFERPLLSGGAYATKSC